MSTTNSLAEIGMGSRTGVGTISASSPRTPGNSQGIVTDSTVGVAAQASPITLRRLLTSSLLKVSTGGVKLSSNPMLGSYSGLSKWSSIPSGRGSFMYSEFTSESASQSDPTSWWLKFKGLQASRLGS